MAYTRGDSLSALVVPQLPPGKYPDGRRPDGLHLVVTPAGARVWRLRYWHSGKEKQISLGQFPDIGIAKARRRRDEAKLLLRDGIDPSLQRKAEAAQRTVEFHHAIQARKQLRERTKAAKHAAGATFGKIAKDWYDQARGRWKSGKHADQVWASLESELKSLWTRPIDTITSRDVLDVILAIEKRPAPEVAKRTLQRASRVVAHAMVHGHCKANPAAGLTTALASRREKHFARVTLAELPALLKKIDEYRGWQTRWGLKLLALTFVRSGELRFATWDEFHLDGDDPTWRIPAERMKAVREHLVPLAPQAVAILRELFALNGRHRYVLPMESQLDKPASENLFLQALKKMGYGKRMTGHGFRSIASTALRELGYAVEIIEIQLAHVERSKVIRAYSSAQYLPQRRAMMNEWADYLDQLIRRGR